MKKPLLICVVGPTGIGKTALAIELAQAFSTEIISSDSRQFFREMRIGTAVPSEEELAAVPHHFIHSHSIFDDYSVGDFDREAVELIESKFYPKDGSKGFTTLIMVGGSGLYTDAVVKGLDSFPTASAKIRETLNNLLETQGLETLQNRLKEVDPAYFEKVDIQNPHRVIRALEVFEASGLPYSTFLNEAATKRNFDHCYIGLTADREIIYDRINRRVDLMIDNGLLEEAKSLYPHRDQNALQTVGYRELFDYLDNKISLDDAISEIKKNTRRFAKRQLTWYRKNPDVNWFDYETPVDEIVKFVKDKDKDKNKDLFL